MKPTSRTRVPPHIGFSLSSDFPTEWKQICKLDDIKSVPPEVLTQVLAPVIYRYRRMYTDQAWAVNIKQWIQAADDVLPYLHSMRTDLTKLDSQHRKAFMVAVEWLQHAINLPRSEKTFVDVVALFSEFYKCLSVYRMALSLATGISEKGYARRDATSFRLGTLWMCGKR